MLTYIDLPEGQGDEVETPPRLFEAIGARWNVTWDAAATPDNSLCGQVADCLKVDWRAIVGPCGTVFMNMPYSDPAPFLAAAQHYSELGVSTVALVKADHSTSWWRSYVEGHIIMRLQHRVRFFYKGQPLKHVAAFPSVLVFYDGGLLETAWR
jgi:phage N-6-adenine-methyltransferase